jgi:FkbM family methyltransferase
MHLSPKTRFLNFIRKIFQSPVFERYLVQRTLGKSPKNIFSKLVPPLYQYTPNTLRQVTRDGITMELDISDYQAHYIYFGFTDKGMEKLFTLCKEGYTVVDVGSNIGYVLLNLAQIVGSRGKVYGFEPDPLNYARCLRNVKLNTFENIHLENAGLGHVVGTFNLTIDSVRNRGGNRISLKTENKDSVAVKVLRLDDFFEVHNITRVDLMKVDVEGFELNVLRGAENFLKKSHPILFIELDDRNLKEQGHSAVELVKYIMGLQYKIIHAETGETIDAGFNFLNKHFDIVCYVDDNH